MMRIVHRVFCLLALALLLRPLAAGAVSRFLLTLDGGSEFVTVDNASQYSDSWVGSRVLAADRSMQDDCNFTPADYKGLMKTGDRVFVSDYYIAWFDLTLQDRIGFGRPYASTWPRSGGLAGWWTLKPATGDFRYKVTGPHGCDWAPKELIPGSASPSQEQHWWDKYGPPTEHSLQVVIGSDCETGQCHFFGHHFSQAARKGAWALSKDGVVGPMFVGSCNGPAENHMNHDAATTPSFQDKVPHKAWLKVGESPTLAAGKPRFRWKSFGAPNAGAGTYGSPLRIDWDKMIFWNETYDGTIGVGVTRGPYSDPAKYKTLQVGTWYQGKFEL